MDINQFKTWVQNFMTEGLMLVVGSGLSCALGLPGMGTLMLEIAAAVAADAPPLSSEWAKIEADAVTSGLEAALHKSPPSPALEEIIKRTIFRTVRAAEQNVFDAVLAGKFNLPFSELLKWVAFPQNGLPILTTNYDRLIELACECAGYGVDTLFDGQIRGTLLADRWKYSQIQELRPDRGKQRSVYRKFARVLKPHGSVDWWEGPIGPFRYGGELELPRMMVTPGVGKYRAGYNEPFDTQRSVANDLLSSSARILLLGYGFNDDHIEATRLKPQILAGKPSLLVAMELTPNARNILAQAGNLSAIEALDPHAGKGTRVHHRGEVHDLPSVQWWNLPEFTNGILRP